MEIFSQSEQDKIVQAISVAENRTSGEIRLVVERQLKDVSVFDRATYFFEKLEMHKTIRRNGVLIYIASDDHEFAIIGDSGIDEKVPEDFWETVKEHMLASFREGDLVNGLIAGIRESGEQLERYFPSKMDDINELPNDIYFGKN